MRDYAKARAKAAEWMYKRKDRPVDWWRWQVLTTHNNDPDTLGLDDRSAFLIFADLVHNGLLVPSIGSDGIEAFAINPGKEADWKRLMSPCRYWPAQHTWSMFWLVVSTVVSSGIGLGLGLWWDNLLGK
jgi:hypothetical protein